MSKNLLSEYHIRYGGYGGIGYYHVSDSLLRGKRDACQRDLFPPGKVPYSSTCAEACVPLHAAAIINPCLLLLEKQGVLS
jgi:hypothetical protein